ncbi:MAG: FAD-binding protein, partial [bacterium]|nr:FAD-binding protein [bacterium]
AKMTDNNYDVAIIGAGVAGMASAAMLAKDFGKKVIVLEQAPFIGGRTFSVVGKGNKVVVDGIEMGPAEFRKALGHTRCLLGKCTPDLETIFEKGMLDGLTFEGGGHGLFWGNKSRVSCVLNHLGTDVEMPLNKGFGFVEWEGEGKPGTAHQVAKGQPYPWMSDEGFRKTMGQLGSMGTTTFEDMAKLMKTPLQGWLESQDLHPEAYDYIKVLAASQTAQAEPEMTPAGDFLGYMAIARDIGMNLVKGSVATVAEPGPIAIPLAMEKVLLEHGGEVRRGTPVRSVLIDDGEVKGVEIETDGKTETLRVDQVICTIPPKYIFKVLPKQHFPSDWVELLETKFWGAGLLTGWGVFNRSVWQDIGIEPSSFIYMPAMIREGYIGAVDMVMTEFTAYGEGNAKRGPEGKHDFIFSTALTDVEMRDPSKVNKVIETCEGWARATFPNWDEDLEFMIWTPSPEAYGLWRPIGEARPDVKSPHVEGLYFAGDQYGKRLWGGGVDGASLSGVMCVDEMMKTNYEEKIFPEYHRGIPDIEA